MPSANPKKPIPLASDAESESVANAAKTPVALSPLVPKMPATNKTVNQTPDYVVGIGGSAGGLEAFEQFLTAMPADSGAAFVIITHLPPNRKGMLVELLQRDTTMPVVQAEEEVALERNCVYIIPPNKDIALANGVLTLRDTVAGLRLPVDFFFASLAHERGEKAIAIVLSGMGADGSIGLKAVKSRGGLVIVQDPTTAKFDSMPRSAIETGSVDLVLSIDQIPAEIVNCIDRNGSTKVVAEIEPDLADDRDTAALKTICSILFDQLGTDFSFYKDKTVLRRIDRRIAIHQVDGIDGYVELLKNNAQEVTLLFQELLIGVTNFFRDPEEFEVLKQSAILPLLKSWTSSKPVRIWIAGCSTGEEAYSVAIICQECLEALGLTGRLKVQIFATDLCEDSIVTARRGVYSENISSDVSAARLARFFTVTGGGYKIRKDVRDMLVFAPHNLLQNAPFTRLDLIVCRNVLIYFISEAQRRVIKLFYQVTNPNGCIFIGTSETVGDFVELFTPVDTKCRIYRRNGSAARLTEPANPVNVSAPYLPTSSYPAATQRSFGADSLQSVVQSMLVQDLCPPSVLITQSGDVVLVNGRTGKYLELPVGKVNINVFAMAREGVRYDLVGAVFQAVKQQSDVQLTGLSLMIDGKPQYYNLLVKPLTHPDELKGLLLVVFTDKTPDEDTASLLTASAPAQETIDSGSKLKLESLDAELNATRARLQAVIEQMRSGQEDLQSVNEEMQSTNEELQSTNEELMTSREEQQALNEELTTLNAELQSKNGSLTATSDDMKNLLNAADVATLFLDRDLNIRRFTPQITRIINLRNSDIGRPAADIVSNLRVDELTMHVKEVIDSLAFQEFHVETKDNHWYLMRILPYKTQANVIEGAVLTFVDITAIKTLEQAISERDILLQDAATLAETVTAAVRVPVLLITPELSVVSVNDAFCATFDIARERLIKRSLHETLAAKWNIDTIQRQIDDLMTGALGKSEGSGVELNVSGVFRDKPKSSLKMYAHLIKRKLNMPPLIVITMDEFAARD